MFAWKLFTSVKLVFYLKVWIIVAIYYAETLQLLDAGSRSSFILTNFATLKYIINNKHWYSYTLSLFWREIFFWCRYVDTFIVYSNSKRRPQWNIQSCQQRDMENGYLETNTIEHFDVLQLSAKWSLTNNAFYPISVLVSSLFIADVSPAHISAQHQSGQIKSKHIHILISNSCSNCKFLAGGTWQWRGGGRGLLQMMHGKCRRSWNRVTDNILGSFLGLSSLECAHFCCCFPPSLVRQQSVSGCRVFVQVETRYI